MKLDSTYLIQNFPERLQSRTQLRVGAFQSKSYVAGPGARAVLWVTGCNRRCPGCIKPEFFSFDVGTDQSVEDVARMILACDSIDGVTYSGGEPFEQASALAELSKILRAANLNVLSYSGYRLEALVANPARFGALLHQLDWLIDGEYQASEFGPLHYLGSSNQRLLKRHSATSFADVATEKIHEVQVSLSERGLRLTGFPTEEFEVRFKASLASRGIELSRVDSEIGDSLDAI